MRTIRFGLLVCVVFLVGGGLWFKVIRYRLPRPFPVGQCTWYAVNRAKQDGWNLQFTQQYGRDAKDWAKLFSNSELQSNPTPGSIMVLNEWGGNPYGHVAYVESVEDANHFSVTHANMSAGEQCATQSGVVIRKCSIIREGDFVRFNKKGPNLRIIGFLRHKVR